MKLTLLDSGEILDSHGWNAWEREGSCGKLRGQMVGRGLSCSSLTSLS